MAGGDEAMDDAATGEGSWASEPAGDRTLEENWLFRLRRERFRSRRTGQAHDYYVVHLADAVTAVATTPDGRVVLVRQFRAGSRRDHWETPGGLLAPGEDPGVAGARELFEETGYRGDPPIVLGTVWTNPALVTTRMTTLLIANARPVGDATPDEAEEVEVGLFARDEVAARVADGRIDHALAYLALLTWLARPGQGAIDGLNVESS